MPRVAYLRINLFPPWNQIKYLLLRGFASVTCVLALFYSVQHLPIGDTMQVVGVEESDL